MLPSRTELFNLADDPYEQTNLAEANPDLVCGLHRGMVEGLVDTLGDDEVTEFHSLVHRSPCQVELVGATDTTSQRAETHLTDRMEP